MNQYRNHLTIISFIIVAVLSLVWLITGFNLLWVEVNDNYAEVTINFLVPMEQQSLNKHIRLSGEIPYANQFDYSIKWLNKQVALIKIKEKNLIKGQQVKLLIESAPTKWAGINKSEAIDIYFKSKIQILSPKDHFVISSTQPFEVQFNTPMDINHIYKYFECDAIFYIKPYVETLTNGNKYIDSTRFVFKPKTPLENNKKYVLSFKKGMPSKAGTLLEKDQLFILQVDKKPIIKNTYPSNGDKWIGLYPRFTLTSQTPMTKALLTIDGNQYIGQVKDPYHVYFLLNSRLLPETSYNAVFQIQAASGELSNPYNVVFSTTALEENRIWLEILCGSQSIIHCYKGQTKIKSMPCSIGKDAYAPSFGTFYLQEKADVYEDYNNREGANFWLKITDQYGIQGYIRDSYWNIKNEYKYIIGASVKRKNVILRDEDVKWLYENVPVNAMTIIRKR